MFKIWGSDGGVFLQIMHVVFATGGSISPLAAKPFLIEVLGTRILSLTQFRIEELIVSFWVLNVFKCDCFLLSTLEKQFFPTNHPIHDASSIYRRTSRH